MLAEYVVRAATLVFAAISLPAHGQLLTVIGSGVLVDRAGKKANEAIDRAEAAAAALIGKADAVAKARLEQVDAILRDTVGGLIGKSEEAALALLEKATSDALALEQQILLDVKRVIWETECAGRRVLISDVGTVMGGLGELLRTNQLRLTPPRRVLQAPKWYSGCLWWCQDPYVVDVMEPFGNTYARARELMEGAIAADLIDDDTPATQLVGTYEYLASLALRTSCFYQGSEDRYNREYIKYSTKAKKWNNVVRVAL